MQLIKKVLTLSSSELSLKTQEIFGAEQKDIVWNCQLLTYPELKSIKIRSNKVKTVLESILKQQNHTKELASEIHQFMFSSDVSRKKELEESSADLPKLNAELEANLVTLDQLLKDSDRAVNLFSAENSGMVDRLTITIQSLQQFAQVLLTRNKDLSKTVTQIELSLKIFPMMSLMQTLLSSGLDNISLSDDEDENSYIEKEYYPPQVEKSMSSSSKFLVLLQFSLAHLPPQFCHQ